MNEQEIRSIVRDEMNRQRYQAGNPVVLAHQHDGIDSPQISEQNIIGKKINSGSITFSQQTTYTLAVNFAPKSIWFYGIAVNSISSPTIRAQCTGNALLGGAYYMAPSTATTTNVGTASQDIAQSSTYFLVDDLGNVHALADQTHLVDVEYGGTIYARMTVKSTSGSGIVLVVDNLASGWSIIGNFVIT